MKPSIGRIVYYQAYGTPGGEYPACPRAAIITEVNGLDGAPPATPGEDLVGLCVQNPTGLFFNRNVKFSATPKPGCWSWPPRVE